MVSNGVSKQENVGREVERKRCARKQCGQVMFGQKWKKEKGN